MNDYMEVEHGFDCLNTAYKSAAGDLLKKALDSCFLDLASQVTDKFNGWLPTIREDTYLTCLSEHFDHENSHGRLSMWRAYGGHAGVAIVLNVNAAFHQEGRTGLAVRPVGYHSHEQVKAELEQVSEQIRNHAEDLRKIARDEAEAWVFDLFRYCVLCTKNPGFAEEREWRVIVTLMLEESPLLTQAVEVINGIPQIVQKLSLRNQPEKGVGGLEIPEILSGLIIGPCEFPQVMYKAFHQHLLEADIPNPEKLLHVSEIPLRLVRQ